jgi:hypothetical protein
MTDLEKEHFFKNFTVTFEGKDNKCTYHSIAEMNKRKEEKRLKKLAEKKEAELKV